MDIDHEYTNEIVCPHCGYKFKNSWEYTAECESDCTICCKNCEKEFYAGMNVEVTYSTTKARYGKCKHCGEYGVIESLHSTLGKYTDLCVECGRKEELRLMKEYTDKLIAEMVG